MKRDCNCLNDRQLSQSYACELHAILYDRYGLEARVWRNKQLARELKVGFRTIQRALTALEQAGYIERWGDTNLRYVRVVIEPEECNHNQLELF